MGETLIDKIEVDSYKEHPQHNEFMPECSTCFSEKMQIDSDNTCEKCGEETSDRLIGDEVATYCSNCNG